MNTTSHVVLNLFFQRRLGEEPALSKKIVLWGVAGSLHPDLPMVLFFVIVGLVQQRPQEEIWGTLYFLPRWKAFFGMFNSIPLYGAGFLLFFLRKRIGAASFFLGGLLHTLADLLLHHDDGHAHFWPFTDWVFSSPVSYWDPAHFGWVFAPFEFLLTLGASWWLWRGSSSKVAKGLLIVVNLFNLSAVLGTYFMFGDLSA